MAVNLKVICTVCCLTESIAPVNSTLLFQDARLKIMVAIEEPPVIVRILAHLGLSTQARPLAPAQRFEWLARASGWPRAICCKR